MKILTREWFEVKRSDTFTVVPLGDVHIGARACDEKLFRELVARIARDKNCYWVGMGDYCDFITGKDPRFSIKSLAAWVTIDDLLDLAAAQAERFLNIVKPIAGQCLGLVEGNHETAILRHYERDVYREIVTALKGAGGFAADYNLAIGYSGWLILKFYRSKKRRAATVLKVKLHHGHVGGRLAGAKALNMQRHLWNNNADLIVFGHSHNTMIQVEAVEEVDRNGNLRYQHRVGAYAGTFLRTTTEDATTYSEVKGYFPIPLAGIEVVLRPGAKESPERLKVLTR